MTCFALWPLPLLPLVPAHSYTVTWPLPSPSLSTAHSHSPALPPLLLSSLSVLYVQAVHYASTLIAVISICSRACLIALHLTATQIVIHMGTNDIKRIILSLSLTYLNVIMLNTSSSLGQFPAWVMAWAGFPDFPCIVHGL